MKYRSTTNPRLTFYVEPAIPQGWIVVSQVKGYPPTEHTGTIYMEEQDADDEARAVANGQQRLTFRHTKQPRG